MKCWVPKNILGNDIISSLLKSKDIKWKRLNSKIKVIWAPYVPFLTSNLIYDETFTAKQGFMDISALKMINPKMYAPSVITNTTPITYVENKVVTEF